MTPEPNDSDPEPDEPQPSSTDDQQQQTQLQDSAPPPGSAEDQPDTSPGHLTGAREVDLRPDDEDYDPNDPNTDVSDEVLEAMEEGKEAGTIREVDDPFEPPPDDEFSETPLEDSDSTTQSDTSSTSQSTESTGSPMDGVPESAEQDLDFDGLADDEDEWTWGQTKDELSFTYKGMKVVMAEPEEDDEILNVMRQGIQADGGEAEDGGDPEMGEEQSQMDRLKMYALLAVKQPNLTEERWEQGMSPTERLTIGSIAANYLNAEDFTEAPGAGRSHQQES